MPPAQCLHGARSSPVCRHGRHENLLTALQAAYKALQSSCMEERVCTALSPFLKGLEDWDDAYLRWQGLLFGQEGFLCKAADMGRNWLEP